MLSKNEWDPISSILVGSGVHCYIPEMDTSLRTINYAHEIDPSQLPMPGVYPDQVTQETIEDLENLADFFISLGIETLRPNNEIVPEYYYYCPRDNIFVYDDLILATPMPLRCRADEVKGFEYHINDYVKKFNIRYEKPRIKRPEKLYNKDCIANKNILALTEIEAAFDAANIIKANDDIFYLVSNSANKAGASLLQEILGNKAKVWTIENVYSYMHIDSTISFLREGLMLLNPSRIKSKDQLPKPLQSWDVIWAPEPVDIGHYPGYCNSSKWLNVNLLMVNPNLAVIDKHQENLALLLKQYNIECQMMQLRHQRTLGGGFHCVTLDFERKHS